MDKQPETLQEAIIYFSSPDNCRDYLVARRWPNGVACPRCGSLGVVYQAKYSRWQCGSHHERRQFTLKTGTIFEDSPVTLDKWLVAIWQVVNCKNGVSSYEIHRAIGVTQKTAWFMDHRIRLALGMEAPEKLSGEVEVDETFIGGKAKNMHKHVRERKITGRGPSGKAIVMGILERGGKAWTAVIPNREGETLQPIIRRNVEEKTEVFTDAHGGYIGLDADYLHGIIDHAVAYVEGRIHTNGMENYWSLLKRGIHGTYVSIEPFHLFRYLDEQTFRFNNRKGLSDGDRLNLAVMGIAGKRLTWKRLIGEEESGRELN